MTASEGPRRLLVISYHFPPDGAVGGLRWAGFSRYLPQHGWEVHIVTAATDASNSGLPGVHVYPVPRRTTLNDRYRAFVAKKRGPSNAGAQSGPPAPQSPAQAAAPAVQRRLPSAPIRFLGAIRYLVGESMFLPDQGRGWIMRAASTARGLMRQHTFDIVLSSGPPHSAHFAGMFATLTNDTPHWIDMRDPWSDPFRPGAPTRHRSVRLALAEHLERIIFRHVKRVIVNTSEFARTLRARETKLDVIYMPNGINTEHLPRRTEDRFGECSLAYVGTLYANRNLTSVLAAMAQMVRDDPSVATRLKLRIAGPMAAPHRRQFERDLAEHGLSNLVEVLGVVSRQDAMALLNKSHLALVLAQNQPMAVPAKLYETVGLGVPTLVIAEADSASAREGKRIGTHVADPEDIAALRAIFENAVNGRLPPNMQPKVPIDYLDLSKVMNRVLRGDRRTERDDSRPVSQERRRRSSDT